LTPALARAYRAGLRGAVVPSEGEEGIPVKIRNSIKSAKSRERNCLVVRRKRRLYVINKLHRRYKTRQG
jgi:large subunit ribosomal protein L36